MAVEGQLNGRAPKTLGHLRITIRHFLGRGVQGVVVAGSTGRVAPPPWYAASRPKSAPGFVRGPRGCEEGVLAKTRPAILCGPLQGKWRPSPGIPTRPSATAQASDWGSKEARAASNVSSGVEPITGSGASVMRCWALHLGREAPPCILSSTRNHQSAQVTMRNSNSSNSLIRCPYESRFYESGY